MLQQGFNAAIAERDQCYQVIDAVMPFLQVNLGLNQEIEAMDQVLRSLTPFVTAAEVWKQDALAHEQVLDNVCYLMSDPDFLVFWASKVWNSKIQSNGQAALEWISDEYLNLLNTYEQRFMAANSGQHSQMWFRMQPKTVNPVMGSVDSQNYAEIPPQFQQQQYPQQFQQQQQQYAPMPPVPGNTPGGGGPVEELKARIAMLKSGNPALGQTLQRMHAQTRQFMNADIYV